MHLIHRGIVNKNYKENLLNSFKTSFKKGYGIETDIHATKDGEFVCFHDFTLKRIHKINKSIKNLSYTKILNLTKKNPISSENDQIIEKKKNNEFLELDRQIYGPLIIQNKSYKKIKGRKILNVINQKNKKLILSVNCDTDELDVRIPGRKWRGGEPAKEEFEKKLINDFC